MHTSTQAGNAAILSHEREFTQRLLVDWNNNAAFDHPLSDLSTYVVSTVRDQTLTSTAPEEVMLIEGYAAGSLKVALTGAYDDLSLAAHFAPYNGRSIFYTEGISLGVTMIYEIAVNTGLGWEWYPQFVGVVRDVNTDRESGSVELDCLDNVERLRTSVDVPPYALWQSYLQDGYKRGGLVDSSSVIDLAARSGDFTMGPATRWAHYKGTPRGSNYGPILSVPFHGSVLPEIGMCDGDMSFHLTEVWETNQFAYRAEAYRDGPHGYLALNAVPPERADGWGYKKYWIDEFEKQAGTAVGTWVLGAWVYWTGNNVDGDSVVLDVQVRVNRLQLFIYGANGHVQARLIEPDNPTPQWTNTGFLLGSVGWHYIEANILVENAANYAMRVRIDDRYSPEVRWSGRNARDVNDRLSGLVRISNRYAISDAYVVKHNQMTAFSNFTYDTTPADTARVSWGRNRVAYTLRDSGREAWDLAKEVSSAEYGVVFFDEYGRFVFWNYRDMTARQSSPVRTFTLDDLESLSLRNTLDSIRNVWTVTTTTARSYDGIAYDLGRDGVPFKRAANGQLLPDVFILPPGSANVYYFQVSDTVISINPYSIPYLPEFHPWEQETPIFGNKSYSGDNYRVQGPNSEQKLTTRHLARLYLTNGYGEPVGFVLTSTGQPRFRLAGRLVNLDEPSTWSVRDTDSVAQYGERVIELASNFWLQDEWQTRGMLADIVSRMGRPIPVSDTLTVPGDPRIQLGDTIQVQDLEGFGERMWLQTYGIRREYGEDGLTDTYTVEMVTAAGVGVWDSPTYGLWDQSLIWS